MTLTRWMGPVKFRAGAGTLSVTARNSACCLNRVLYGCRSRAVTAVLQVTSHNAETESRTGMPEKWGQGQTGLLD